MDDADRIAAGLTKAQRDLLIASEPGGWGRADMACGVELRGPAYSTAKALAARKLGTFTSGSVYGDLYFNSRLGLAVRTILEQANAK